MCGSIITIEPTILLYTIAVSVLDATYINQMMIGNEGDIVEDGLKFINNLNWFYRTILIYVSILMAISLMCWSDKVGRCRRPLMILPIIGLILRSWTGLIQTYFFVNTATTAVSAICSVAFKVITADTPLMMMACLTYLCDVSRMENRTMKMGLFFAIGTLGEILSAYITNLLVYERKFIALYGLCFIVAMLALLFTLICVKDVQDAGARKLHSCQMFNCCEVLRSFGVIFKKNLECNRIVVICLISAVFLMAFAFEGEGNVQFYLLYVEYKWDSQTFAFWEYLKKVGEIIGVIFCSVVLSKLFKMHDSIIGILSGVCGVAAALQYFFSNTNKYVYIASCFDVFHFVSIAASISFLSKFYKNDELGRLCAVFGTLALFAPRGYFVYDWIFRKTFESLPEAFYLLSVVTRGICILLFSVAFFLYKKPPRRETATTRGEEVTTISTDSVVVQ